MIKPIKNTKDYKKALRRVDELWGAPKGTPEGDELDVLADLIVAYEEDHDTASPLDPVLLLRGAMDNLEIGEEALAQRLQVPVSHVEDLLQRKQRFTESVVNVLVTELKLYRDWFYQDLLYEKAQQAPRARSKASASA